ncbi:Clathrin/coatomer adaptor adaptin-like N-terminal [Trinorchestia longiramus]|nr:Clathrin/coatomer adaptor adaptin-like N-terminal [Trinorchestia longiramus]
MARKVEDAVGGLVQSLLGGLGSQTSLFGGGAGTVGTQPSLGFLTFLEKLQEASNLSREDERQFLESCAEQWLCELNKPAFSAGSISAVMQRALVAACRGYIYPQLHIHAVKLTQALKVPHKKIGYLYLSVCAEQSELSLLTTNTLHKDLQGRDALALLAALTALPSVLRSSLPPQLLHALANCLHHPISLVRRRTCQVLYAELAVWSHDHALHEEAHEGQCRAAADLPEGDPPCRGRSHSPLGGSNRSDYGSYDGSHRSSCDEAFKPNDSRLEASSKGNNYLSSAQEPRCTYSSFAQDLLIGEVVPSLLQLLSDDDPSVAIAATQTLALLYQHSNGQLDFVRNSVSCSAAHLLTEAFNATLPRGYNTHSAQSQPMNAPHVQLAMLKALRQLCMGSAVNTLLGFLKTSNCRLQLAAVTVLAQNWAVLKDCVTPALLHAVVHNLHTTTSTIITNTTLHLLYTMANERNYKSVLGTLVQYCGAAAPRILQNLLCKMAKILTTYATDGLWCLQQLQPLLLMHPHPALARALGHIVSSGIERGCQELVSPALSLLNEVLQQSPVPRPHLVMAAVILTRLGDTSAFLRVVPPTLDGSATCDQSSSSLSGDKLDLVLPDADSMPFMSDDERSWLYKVNEKFISKIIFNERHNDDDQIIFECLMKIGLYDDALRDRAVGVALSLVNSPDLVHRSHAREVLVWLRRRNLSLEVLKAERQQRDNLKTLDWSLPFVEDYIVESLEKKNEMPYLPRSCSVHGDAVIIKPVNAAQAQREEHPVLTPRGFKSYCSTPRSGVSSDPRLSLDQSSVVTSSSSSSNQRTSSGSGAISGRVMKCNQPQGVFTNPDGGAVLSSTPGVVSSLGSLSITSSQLDQSRAVTDASTECSPVILEGDVGTAEQRGHSHGRGARLLWSVEGRSSQQCLGALEQHLPGGNSEDIEVGAEASEELQFSGEDLHRQEDEVPNTAAALAKALYAGLSKK